MPELNLPVLKSATNEFHLTELSVDLKSNQSEAIIKVCKNSELTIFIFLTSITKILVYNYFSKINIPLLIPPLSDSNQVNNIFLENSTINNDHSFKDILLNVKNSVLNYYNKVPLYDHPKSDLESSAVQENISCRMDNIHITDKQKSALADMTFIFKKGSGINISIQYNKNKYEPYIIKHILDYFNDTCDMIIYHSFDILLKDIKRSLSQKTSQIINQFNNYSFDFPKDKTVYHYIDEWAVKLPDRIAVEFEDSFISYKDLSSKSINFTKHLLNRGIYPGEPVAIMMSRGIDMIISILSLWRLGCSYVPISINEPSKRVEQILVDAGISNLLVSIDPKYDYCCHIIKVKKDYIEVIQEESVQNFDINQLAYIIFTSGSSGKPKGVMIEHLGMMNHLFAKINLLSLNTDSIVAHTALHTFDISVWQFFSALIVGGKVVIFTNEKVKEIDGFVEILNDKDISILEVVPSYLSIMEKICCIKNFQFKSLASILVTGETFVPELAERFINLYPKIKMINAYGPTEASDDITHFSITKDNCKSSSLPIGKPIHNVSIYIVDSYSELCPIGVKGEIWVSGIAVGRGYISDEYKTKESFIIDPFIKNTAHSLYKTGDIGCWDDKGNVLFFGRKDNQVKIRGFRIELGEIENVIYKYKGIQTAAIAIENAKGENPVITAYLVTSDESLDLTDLKKFLLESLPSYMQPANIVNLKEFPFTENGKIDKKKLLTMRQGSSEKKDENFSPQHNHINLLIAEILNISPDIKGNANFFEIGGNSLSAIVFLSKINQLFDVKIPLIDFMTYASIYDIADAVTLNQKVKTTNISRAETKDKYKALAKQEKLFFLQDSESTGYNIPIIIKIKGIIDLTKLNNVIREIVNRHEVLRTRFEFENNELFQIIEEAPGVCVQVIDGPSGKIDKIISTFVKPFDLLKSPLLRVALINISDDETVLIIDLHHIVSDGVSMMIMLEDIVKLYENKPLDNLTHQFKDFSEFYFRTQSDNNTQKEYWKKRIPNKQYKINLPYDMVNQTDIPTLLGERKRFAISASQYKNIRDLALNNRSTMFNVLLASYNLLLSKICNQDEIIIGIISSGRHHAELQRTMGMFVEMIPFRYVINDNLSFTELLAETTNLFIEDLSQGQINFDNNRTAENKIDTVFQLQNYYSKRIEIENMSWELIDHYRNISRFNLHFIGIESENSIDFEINFNNNVFRLSTINQIVELYLQLLDIVIANPMKIIGDIFLLNKKNEIVADDQNNDFSYL